MTASTTLLDRPLAVDVEQAARTLGVSRRTMDYWRANGTGPRWSRLGAGQGRIRYRATDLEEYLDNRALLDAATT